jgi:2-polyprenyl-3-methyl-5-hydroxy-6-metoxy-1,4-benzoquinol methylase
MAVESKDSLVKTDFDFGWKRWKATPAYIALAFQYQKGDVLDVGCATCQLCEYLSSQGWKGRYYGIDSQKYEGYHYPKDVELIIGDALKVEFPEVDTVILYNILEHVDEAVALLNKAMKSSKKNVLVDIPKRNEEMWKYGVVEYHQVDKTHKHCGFSKDEVYKMVDLAGGKITRWIEWGGVTIIPIELLGKRVGILILNAKIGARVFPKRTFYTEIWLEVVKK